MAGREVVPRAGGVRAPSGPAWIAAGLLLALTAAGLSAALRATGGTLVLPLDDSYIHLAMARTLVEHGIWGVQAGMFGSASSSPLWVLVLAGVGALAGWGAAVPLALDALGVVALVWVVDRALGAAEGRAGRRTAVLVAIGVLSGVPAVAFTGSEHVWHAAAFLALLWTALRALEPDGEAVSPAALGLLAALATGLRFETLFAVAALAALALARRAWRVGAVLVAGAATPVAVHALVALPRGGGWLPNPLLVKGVRPDLSTWPAALLTFERVPRILARPEAWHLAALLLALVLLALPVGAAETARGRLERRLCAIVAVSVVLHVQLAALGSFYRYEMYLLVAGWTAIAARLTGGAAATAPGRARLRRAATAVALTGLTALAALRGGDALRNLPRASRNVWEQQMQTARFVRWRGSPHAVAVHDLGAVSLLGATSVVDLVGLADDEVAHSLARGRPGGRALAELLARRDADLLVAYEEWLGRWGGAPTGWTAVERWEIRDNLVCAGPVVTFFAPPGGADALRRDLDAFAPRLPVGVARHRIGT
ncbi:MAG: hypothetical protein R2991_15465 [Thermoanaerobaculia bacterium]